MYDPDNPDGKALEWHLVDDQVANYDENLTDLSSLTGILKYIPKKLFNYDYFEINATDPSKNTIMLQVQAKVNAVNDDPSFAWPLGTSATDYVFDSNENWVGQLAGFNATDIGMRMYYPVLPGQFMGVKMNG